MIGRDINMLMRVCVSTHLVVLVCVDFIPGVCC